MVVLDRFRLAEFEDATGNKVRLRAGRGPVGKTAVVGMKDRDTGQITSEVVEATDAPTLQGFVERNTEADAMVYTDDARAYRGMHRTHEAVKHSVSEYVRGMAHTNGMESHWASLKRGYDGVYHQMSDKHLHRYVTEFEGRHNRRPLDTAEQNGSDGPDCGRQAAPVRRPYRVDRPPDERYNPRPSEKKEAAWS